MSNKRIIIIISIFDIKKRNERHVQLLRLSTSSVSNQTAYPIVWNMYYLRESTLNIIDKG